VTKLEFISAFRSACESLPTELVEAALADYERQFTDQFLSGVSEAVIVERWGTPQHAAMKLKVGTLNGNLKESVTVQKVARVGLNGIGLVVMDVLLCVPAVVYAAVLVVFYVAALAMYLSGIFMTSSSLAGVNYIDVPAHYLLRDLDMKGSTHFNFGSIDIVPTELVEDGDTSKPASVDSGGNNSGEAHPEANDHAQHFLRDRGFHIATHIHKGTVWEGVSVTVAGMLFLLLCLLATRFSFLMFRQFIRWQFAVLKNA
jgi:uncharacterized membrane protein